MKSLLLAWLLIAPAQLDQQPDPWVVASAAGDSLKVAAPEKLPLLIEDVARNSLGLTTQAIQTRVELRIRAIGLQTTRPEEPGAVLMAKLTPNVFKLGSLMGSMFVTRDMASGYLYVNLNFAGNAFNVAVEFRRPVLLRRPDGDDVRTTGSVWKKSSVGVHGGNAAYVLDSVSEIVDDFLNEYLKANHR
jgi:hypothetical protein